MARQPNILFIQVDQMAAAPLPAYGGRIVLAPHLQRLAGEGAVFEAAYCNSPICAPSRFSMMTGRLPTSIDAFDNASEFPASLPTLAHFRARAGDHPVLSGKMHFIGPDQLHGFAERLTTDIYPADFAWTPNWAAGPRDKPSGISMINVLQAGTCVRSLQMDYDDEVENLAVQHLYDQARRPGRKPFFLAVSFSHPHPPYTAGREWWDRYRHDDIDMPRVAPIPVEERDVHSQWLHASHGADLQPVSDEQVRNARHAYYANISYIDDKVGRLLRTLAECGMADDTIVVFTSDHGEMFGAQGRRAKNIFYDEAARVPLVVRWPGHVPAGQTSDALCSAVDLLPTLCGLLDLPIPAAAEGANLAHLCLGREGPSPEAVLLQGTGAVAAWQDGHEWRGIRDGQYTYAIYRVDRRELLFNHRDDPDQLHDLAGDPAHRTLLKGYRAELAERMARLNDTFEPCSWYRDHWTADRVIMRAARG